MSADRQVGSCAEYEPKSGTKETKKPTVVAKEASGEQLLTDEVVWSAQ